MTTVANVRRILRQLDEVDGATLAGTLADRLDEPGASDDDIAKDAERAVRIARFVLASSRDHAKRTGRGPHPSDDLWASLAALDAGELRALRKGAA